MHRASLLQKRFSYRLRPLMPIWPHARSGHSFHFRIPKTPQNTCFGLQSIVIQWLFHKWWGNVTFEKKSIIRQGPPFTGDTPCRGVAYAKLPSKFGQRFALLSATRQQSAVRGKQHVAAQWMPAFIGHVRHIVQVRGVKQMARPHTGRIVAIVAYKGPRRLPRPKLICLPVRSYSLSVSRKTTVAVVILRTRPFPTAVPYGHAPPKAFHAVRVTRQCQACLVATLQCTESEQPSSLPFLRPRDCAELDENMSMIHLGGARRGGWNSESSLSWLLWTSLVPQKRPVKARNRHPGASPHP